MGFVIFSDTSSARHAIALHKDNSSFNGAYVHVRLYTSCSSNVSLERVNLRNKLVLDTRMCVQTIQGPSPFRRAGPGYEASELSENIPIPESYFSPSLSIVLQHFTFFFLEREALNCKASINYEPHEYRVHLLLAGQDIGFYAQPSFYK